MKTRDHIIETAVTLFNEQGTDKVTTNHIAEAAKISPGNLYYHYKNKQDIIRSIYNRLALEMEDKWILENEDDPFAKLPEMMTNLMIFYNNYRFFYLDINAILRNDDQLRESYKGLKTRRQMQIRQVFMNLIQRGFFIEQMIQDLDLVVERIWFITEYWFSFKKTQDVEITENTISEAISFMLQILKDYYTETGIKLLNKMES